MRSAAHLFLIGALVVVPAVAFGKTFVVPHVLERSGTIARQATTEPMPSVQEIQQMIERKTGATIKWDKATGQSSGRRMRLTGTGTMGGESLAIKIDCRVSYPPLTIRCTISASW
ncbi:MAG TPA: hypothetical protein DEB30_03555 [Candidatus Peribacter riflensis]|nr:MAG: hypothetical protein A2398_00965 [Candidatus Peribacteria bacterium RIFOXYB1_FULL_57_12]OGJ80259.1 MAG: hypothetical protein A2412_01230 [Candidatus Peribacteria bacterium RIFOXYC1_FULL_58_8]HBH19851.1 hypothetical protein [Candidatus Peribacter riflensis]HBU09845.1 hypothetical protein [Candidatus Peribacter riflensis]